jgi:hypothetical protein
MARFWKSMADLGGEKLEQLGIVGSILGVLWIVGLWVLYDWMTGAWAEGFMQAGNSWGLVLVLWFLIGLGLYLWFDPHGVRTARLE